MKLVIGCILWFAMVFLTIFVSIQALKYDYSPSTKTIGPHQAQTATALDFVTLPKANITVTSADFFELENQKTKSSLYSEIIQPQTGETNIRFEIKNPPPGRYQIFRTIDTISFYSDTPAQIVIEFDLLSKIITTIIVVIVAVCIFMFCTWLIIRFINSD